MGLWVNNQAEKQIRKVCIARMTVPKKYAGNNDCSKMSPKFMVNQHRMSLGLGNNFFESKVQWN
jgi:hypothetical protein